MSTENTPNEMTELLPCPFCEHDGDDLIIRHVEGTILHPSYYVYCDWCGGQGPSTDKGNHVEIWNRRAVRPQPSAEPVAYADPQAFLNFSAARADGSKGACYSREWMWANPDQGLVPMYLATQRRSR